MKYFKCARFIIVIFGFILMFSTVSCKKESPLKEKMLGTWRIKRANIHSIYSFRQNGSWTLSERVEGRFSRIVENKGKVSGQWQIIESEEETEDVEAGLVNFLEMTPTHVASTDKWVKNEPVRFKIMDLNKKFLLIQKESGREVKWNRVRGKKIESDDVELNVAKINTGPLVVNLKRDRLHGKFRYLCLALELSVMDANECEYVAVEKNQEADEVTYMLHPKINDVTILFLSSLTYKDTKTLEKVKGVVKNLQDILNPYFNGKITEIYVVKVVVTTSTESVKDFENIYISAAEDTAQE